MNRSNSLTLALGMALAAPLAAPLAASAAPVIALAPGSVWEYTFQDPTSAPNWNNTTGGWQTGNAPFSNVVGGDFGYGTIWPADSTLGDDLWVRTQVDFSGLNLASLLYELGVDNGFSLYLNGNLVASDNAEGFTSRWEYSGPLPGALPGVNIIALALEDHGGLTAFDMQITGTTDRVPDSTSTLTLLSLGALAISRFRRS